MARFSTMDFVRKAPAGPRQGRPTQVACNRCSDGCTRSDGAAWRSARKAGGRPEGPVVNSGEPISGGYVSSGRTMERTMSKSLTTTEIDQIFRRLPPLHVGEVLREEFLTPLKLSPYAIAKAIGVPRTESSGWCAEETDLDGRHRVTAFPLFRYHSRVLDKSAIGLRAGMRQAGACFQACQDHSAIFGRGATASRPARPCSVAAPFGGSLRRSLSHFYVCCSVRPQTAFSAPTP